jgi:L-cysteine/cystine lyase
VAYLNTGTNGPVPRTALDAMRAELERSSLEPRIGMPYYERLIGLRSETRAAFGRTVGVPAEQIALTNSTTQGVGMVTAGIDWSPGDELITTTEEHPGLLSPLDVVARRSGAVVREVDASDLLDAVTPETRLVAVSHVLWTTGRRLDLPALAERAHLVGAELLVDGAQSVGSMDVRVLETGADYYAFSGQKWLMGPQGTGGLWVAPDRVEALSPALSGYFSLADGKIGQMRPGAARFDGGSFDTVVLAGSLAAMEWVEAQPGGRAGWTERIATNADRARARLAAEPWITIAAPPGPPGPLLAMSVEGIDDLPAAVAGLAERGVLVRFIPGTPYLRVSIGGWTTDEDVERLVSGLSELRVQ